MSQAAVSGAVRHPVQLGFLDKVRQPGSRSDQYRLYDDGVCSAISLQRMPLLDRWKEHRAQLRLDEEPTPEPD
ncbi:hypothetical protein F4561_004941 [Lipingzhangella halophila]|uniref:Uncharacterized protein n=1 Tax=Lipingzhangella halophila TaxID=1783352 RepID=A0A7W7RME4_9ACTN|nr:hypothetical protein [Lipingzhangella halophila]MBB4934121.1 hypothetical protein [Lipingzhangella halophila]